jgi:hypothetical protein
MKKRVAIPLAVIIGLIFWMVIFYNIGKNIEPKLQSPNETQAAQPEILEEPPAVIVQGSETEPPESQPQSRNTVIKNPLLIASRREAIVKNGLGQKIGTRAYIIISQKVLLEEVSLDDVAEFYQSFLGKGYNWVSIICPEGTGLVFPASGTLASYGTLDNEGRLTEDIHWSIIYDKNIGSFKEYQKP